MKAFLLSILSGVIVAVIISLFPFGRRTEPQPQPRPQPRIEPRKGSVIGTLFRFLVAVAVVGGISVAYAGGHHHGVPAPMLFLVVGGAILVWILLSGAGRR